MITATDGHPFWIPGQNKWLNAGLLKPGMWLGTSTGIYVQITAVQAWTQNQQVHNLTIDSIHTYYVEAGTVPVLVHNSGPCDPIAAGEGIGRSARQIPKGSGQLNHIANEITALKLDQPSAANAADAAARVAFDESGGVFYKPLENGNLVVLPTQLQVGAWFEITPEGIVTGRKGTISVVGGELVLTPR